jgi:hypothetical protein
MVIDDLDFVRMAILPYEAHSPLLVDADAVLAFPVCCQGLKPIPWRHLQILELHGRVHLHELPERNTP